MLLFSTKQGMNGAAFICPKCLDQPKGYKSDVITEAEAGQQFSSQQPPIQSSEELTMEPGQHSNPTTAKK